jgi:hypothetical protein
VLYRISFAGVVIILFACVSPCQPTSPSDPNLPGAAQGTADDNPSSHESKRLLWVIPNYRTSPTLENYEPLTTGEKFKLASQDAFAVALAAVFGGGQFTNSNRSFGQGAAGYGRYFGASYGNWLIGDYMTEGVFPTLLHQDTRYFRRSTGSGWSRLGYAMGQIFWTHRDSGGTQFNFSEVLGNSTAVAISNAYYADNRTAPPRSACPRFAPLRFASRRSAPRRSAPPRSALLRFALVRFALVRFTLLRFVLQRPLASRTYAQTTFAPPRFASLRSGLRSSFCSLHRFHGSAPCSKIANCSGYAANRVFVNLCDPHP